MARRDLHIHACEQGGFAIYSFGTSCGPAPLGGHMPVAAFGTLGEALGFIQKEMAPAQIAGTVEAVEGADAARMAAQLREAQRRCS